MKSKQNNFSEFLYSQYDVVQEKINNVSNGPRYSEKTLINQGSQKQIYKVYDTQCSREVAMAVLINDSEEEKAQFLREAKITALLQHPNIMPVYETGIDQEGNFYFTMQLGKGESLSDYSMVSLQDKLGIFLKVCDALVYAHSKGVIHRDIKPDNIYIGQFGEVLLCDWGLAKIAFSECDESLLDDETFSDVNLKVSLKGFIKGTPGFIAPEIIESSDYSEQSDLFAMGVLLHELLTGELPFKGSTVEEVLKNTQNKQGLVFDDPRSSINESLKAICQKSLDSDKTKRYQKVKEISEDVKSYLNGFATDAEEASALTQVKLFYRRNLIVCNLILLFLLSLTILVGLFISSIQKKERLAVNLLEQLQESDAIRKKMEADLIPVYLAKAKQALLNGQPETALALGQVTYNFDRSNKDVRDLYGKALMSMQMFLEATEVLQGVNEEISRIALQCSKIRNSKIANVDKIIAYLRAVGVEPENDKAYIYRNILYEEFSNNKPQNKLTLLRAVLMMRNNLSELKGELNYENDAYILDLSNNPTLKTLYALQKFGPAVVKKLDLSNTSIRQMYPVHNLNIIELSLRNTGKMNLNNFTHFYEYLDAENSKNDFSPFLNNKPVKYLNIHKSHFKDYNVLLTLKNLKTLIVSKSALPIKVRQKLPEGCLIIEK